MIKSLPAQLPGSSPIEESPFDINTDNLTENTPKRSSVSALTSVSETASSVFNKINPFDSTDSNNNNNNSSGNGKNQKEKQNLFLLKLEKLEKTLGFVDDCTNSSDEEEVFEVELEQREAVCDNYANNQGDSNMLENFYTPDHEHTSLLTPSGSREYFLYKF